MSNTASQETGGPAELCPEPLEELARFAFEMAPTLCSDAKGCVDYHRMWSLVRLIESDGALPAGSAFFDHELPTTARDGRAKVVLSGAADTGLMALACNALMAAGMTPQVVVVDRCATPLRQAEAFGQANGVQTTTIKGTLDQLDVVGADAIMAHSFLAFIPQSDREALFQSWARALRVGGKVLLSQRLVPEGDEYERKRPAQKIKDRRVSLEQKLRKYCPVDAEISDLLDMAERLWLNPMGGNGVYASQLRDLCDKTGFALESITYDGSDASVSPFAIGSEATKRARANVAMVRVR